MDVKVRGYLYLLKLEFELSIIEDLDLTMLYHICRQGRLDVYLKQQQTEPTELGGLSQVLYPTKATLDTVTSSENATMLAKGTQMSDDEYLMLSRYRKTLTRLSDMTNIP